MKKLLTLSLTLLTVLSLTATARADVIASPGAIAVLYTMHFLPYILVAAVVLITICLLIKFWKKKK
ncbi:MAG: hypothetical protein K2O45_05375 [Oscillospiraceae bacterium]|nr:hypothetical protein [Oscillospiraceae bacterium]